MARIYVFRERLPMMHRAGWQAHDQPDGVRLVHLGSRSQRASDGGSDFGTRGASDSAARNISGEFGGRSVAADCDAGQLTTCLGPDRSSRVRPSSSVAASTFHLIEGFLVVAIRSASVSSRVGCNRLALRDEYGCWPLCGGRTAGLHAAIDRIWGNVSWFKNGAFPTSSW